MHHEIKHLRFLAFNIAAMLSTSVFCFLFVPLMLSCSQERKCWAGCMHVWESCRMLGLRNGLKTYWSCRGGWRWHRVSSCFLRIWAHLHAVKPCLDNHTSESVVEASYRLCSQMYFLLHTLMFYEVCHSSMDTQCSWTCQLRYVVPISLTLCS